MPSNQSLQRTTTSLASLGRVFAAEFQYRWAGERMFTLERHLFEKAGAAGCSDSSYRVVTLTCCDRQVVEDEELSDLYFDPGDLSRTLSLLGAPSEIERPCPLCLATAWDLTPVHDVADVSVEWRWACPSR